MGWEKIIDRLSLGEKAFEKVKTMLTTRRISIRMRKKFDKRFICSVVLYGSET